ncbi:RnfABCDGE type electron transport complex subunit D [Candidatus Binatia bacterium]|nr:RnfABCDGE type electron transport complex subunit D [Candidatus Binatia bacterium]
MTDARPPAWMKPTAAAGEVTGPFLHSGRTLRRLMFEVVLALLPICVVAIWRYGTAAAVPLGLAVVVAWVFDLACDARRAFDGSAVVAGIVTALSMPASGPIWLGPVGAAAAILVGKHLFGGLGNNVFNPAAVGRVVLMGIVPARLLAPAWSGVDGVSAATPLAKEIGAVAPGVRELLFGLHPGALAEAAPLAVLGGGLCLILMRTVDWRVPLTYLAGVALLALVLPPGARMAGHAPWLAGDALAQLLSGGALLAAFFMLTDPVTAPFSARGRVIFAVLAAVYTMAVRYYTPYPDGAALAVLVANAAVPLLDRATGC